MKILVNYFINKVIKNIFNKITLESESLYK